MPTILETHTLAARPEALDGLHAALEQFWQRIAAHGAGLAPPRVQFALSTAASEIAANIIRYSEAESFELSLRSDAGRRLEAHFEDRGLPFREESAPEPAPGTLSEGGFGLALARRMVHSLHYDRTDDGVNSWRLVVLIPPGTPA